MFVFTNIHYIFAWKSVAKSSFLAIKVIQKQVHNGNKHEQNKSIKTPNLQSKLRKKAAF